jgi:hypothetical protein
MCQLCILPFAGLTLGLYSALRARSAIAFRSKRQSRLTVATMFLKTRASVCTETASPSIRMSPLFPYCRVGTIPLGCFFKSTIGLVPKSKGVPNSLGAVVILESLVVCCMSVVQNLCESSQSIYLTMGREKNYLQSPPNSR